ncbi:Filamentous hemagglutinin [Fusobacterium necrogenes]|uniref:Filamentous hemagglutinin n=1 Tax=Fusobacterium necrogenes TaxID=858 RepID=A0A377GWF1_9FUSO|nr:hemagglutinin repeat-containing protein [Fusobacterium necrogenes]STO31330.1 Filamentous hemagglutinin [Fusobacterium necrogenes]
MNYLKLNEKLLKHHLKNKKRITLSLIVTFMITGGLGITEEEILARDLRPRQAKNDINIGNDSPGLSIDKAANGKTDVVNIVTPGANGISHNKFVDFNVGEEGIIFNNNGFHEYVNSQLGGIVHKNANLSGGAAKTILNEVTGMRDSYLNGVVEVAGEKADFILANENGITVNGAGFINTSGVTLTTGKVNNNNGNLSVDVTKGNVVIEGSGVEVSGNYFNIISQTIELFGQVSSKNGENDADLNFIAGNNKVDFINTSAPQVTGSTNGTTSEIKYGIHAGPLGAMYGNNIRLISTAHGLGVRHEGIIRSKGDITIEADGDIAIGGLNSEKNITVTGKGKLETINGTYKVDNKIYNYSIVSTKGINLNVTGDMEINSFISANGAEGLQITAKNLKILGDKKTTAGILAQGLLLIKVEGDITIEALLRPVRNGSTSDDPPLVVGEDGKVIDPITGEILNESQYSWVGSGIQGERIEISSTNFTNDSTISNTRRLQDKSSIKITATDKLINNKLISSSGKLELNAGKLENKEGASLQGSDIKIVAGSIENVGDIRQNVDSQGETADRFGKVEIDFTNGNFINKGTVSGYEVVINGTGFILENTESGKIVASTVDYPLGQGSITIKVKDLKNKGLIQSYGSGFQNDITIDVETLSNILGHIIAQRGNITITSKGEIVNSGEIYAEKDVNITSTGASIRNEGGSSSIGAAKNVTITAENAKLENSGKIYAAEKLLVIVSELLNNGSSDGLKKYLEAFYNLGQDGTKEIDKIIGELEGQLQNAPTETEKQLIQQKIDLFKDLKEQLKNFNSSLETLPNIGTMSANSIDITTKKLAQNNGIIKANNDIQIASEDGINNTGILEAGTDVTLEAKGNIVNSQRIYAGNKIDITGKSFKATGSDKLLTDYATTLSDFSTAGGDAKLDELNKKIADLEAQLKSSTGTDLQSVKTQIDNLIKEREKLAALKAKISSLAEKLENGKDGTGLSTIESKNVNITTTNGPLSNAGIIVTSEDLTLKAQGNGSDITNTGNVAVGNNANISGNSFTNNAMTVGGKFTATLQDKLESESLKIVKGMDVTAKNAQFTNLEVGENANITLKENGAGNVTFGKDGSTSNKVNITGNLGITGGGLINKAETAVKGSLNVDKNGNNSAKFENTGTLGVNQDATIKTNGFTNSGNIVTEKGLNVESSSFTNSGEMVVKEKLNVTSTGAFENSKDIVARQGFDVKSTSFTNKQNAKINTTDFTLKAGDAITNQGSIEAKGNLDIDGEKTLNNSGKILVQGSGKIDIKESINNSGEIKVGKSTTATQANGTLQSGDLLITTGTFTNKGSGKVSAENDLDIVVTSGFNNEANGEIAAKNILIDGTATTLSTNFENSGTIASEGTLTVDLGSNKKDINLGKSGKMSSKDTMTLKTGGNISNEGKFSNIGGLDFQAGKAITNKGMILSLGDINLRAKESVTNGEKNGTGSTIWSEKKITITSETGDINNYQYSTIKSKGDMTLTATNGTLLNEGGTISSGGNLNIDTKTVINKSIVNEGKIYLEKPSIDPNDTQIWGDAFDNVNNIGGTKNSTRIEIWFPKIVDTGAVQAQATIEATGNLGIKIKEKLENDVATIRSGGNLNISGAGQVINKSLESKISLEEYLKHTLIRVEDTIRETKPAKEVIVFAGTFYDGINANLPNNTGGILNYNPVLIVLAEVLDENAGGHNWQGTQMKNLYDMLYKASGGKIEPNKKLGIKNTNELAKVETTIYSAKNSAKILAGKDITLNGVEVVNGADNIIKNQSVDVKVGSENVGTVDVNLDVSITDPNDITETNGIKYPDGVEVIKGSVTINGVTIDASTGGLISAIAVAGTINPIGYIEIPKGDNGIFRPADPRPGQNIQYKFETNIDFIDPSKYFGSEYFFGKIGYDPDRTSTVIGDAYYETQLINKVIKEALGYTGEVTADYIKTMLDSAAETQGDLGLVVGKALTPDQINSLEKDIIWYVEVEMDGEKVLVPQVYFGKETRIEMAQGDKGGGYGSTIKAGGNIDIKGGSVSNTNANIVAGGDINMDVTGDITNSAVGGFQGGISAGGDISLKAGGDLDMIGGTITSTDGGVSVETGGDINIESTLGGNLGNQTISNKAGITAKGDVTVNSGGDTTIKNGTINSSEGDVALTGKNVNIEDQNLISSGQSFDSDRISKTESSYTASTSVGSEIGGKNVSINAENDINIKGSGVVAENDLSLDAGKNVNITDGQNHYYGKTTTETNGFDMNYKLNVGSSTSETQASASAGSTVGGLGNVTIKSGQDTNIKGSDVISGGDTNVIAGGNVNITDGKNTEETKSSSSSYDVISYTKKSSETKSSTSQGSSITSGGNINIKSGGDVTSVGGEFNSLGDTNIDATGNVKFEAGKNEYEEKSNSFGVGIISGNAGVGAGGASANAGWDINNGGYSEVVNGKASDQTINDMNKVGKSGKNYMDSLAKADATIGISIQNKHKKETTWTEGSVNTGGDINIKSGGTTDIGGSDFNSKGDFNITANDIDSTKYTDEIEETSSGFNVGVKVGNNTTSSIADAVNKGMQIHENATDSEHNSVNGALVGAQVAGTVSNVIFGDLVGNVTSVTGEFGYNNSYSKTTEENITNITSGGDINFKTTGGDINLKGVEMDGNDITLDSAKDINISSAKKTEVEHSTGVNVSVGGTVSAGVGTIDGANAQVGVTGNVSVSKNDKNNQTNTGSSINGNNITIKSGGDTNVIGSNVSGNDVTVDVGGDLNIKTETDNIDEKRTEGWAGGDLSGGVASNTIVTGDAGISAGGGSITKSGDKINNQAGITAKNKIDVTVDGDLNLKGGVVGSDTGDGSLTVKGDVNVEDVKSNYEEGGAIVGVNGGTKGGGILGEVGDNVDLEKTAKGTIGINKDNITVGGDVTVNGKTNTGDDKLEGVNTDMDGSITVDKDVSQGGGTFSGTASKLPGKKTDSGSYDLPDGKQPPPPPIRRDPEPVKVDIPTLPDIPKPTVKVPIPEEHKVIKIPRPEIQYPVVEDLPKPQKPIPIPPKPDPDPDPDPIIPEFGKIPRPEVHYPVIEELPKPQKPEIIPPKPDPDPDPPKKPVVGGYVKDENGKWVPAYSKGMGAALTGGGLTSGGLKGYQDGVKSLIKGETQVPNRDDKKPVKPPQYEGKYIKDENGNWHKTTYQPGDVTIGGKASESNGISAPMNNNTNRNTVGTVGNKNTDGATKNTSETGTVGNKNTDGATKNTSETGTVGNKNTDGATKNTSGTGTVGNKNTDGATKNTSGTGTVGNKNTDGATKNTSETGTVGNKNTDGATKNTSGTGTVSNKNTDGATKNTGSNSSKKKAEEPVLAPPAPAPITTTVKTPAPIPDVPRPEVKVPIPGAGGGDGRPALPPVDYNQGGDGRPALPPADYNQGGDGRPALPPVDYNQGGDGRPALPPVDYNQGGDGRPALPPADYNQGGDGRPALPPVDYNQGGDVKLPLPPADYNQGGILKSPSTSQGTGNSQKKVSFDDGNIEVGYVPKNDSTRKPYDDARDTTEISKDIDKLLGEQKKLTDKQNSGKKLSKKEQEKLNQLEKDLAVLNDELVDAIGRDKADRPDDERIPEEMANLVKERQQLMDKVNRGEQLTAEQKDRLNEIELDIKTLENTIANSKSNVGGSLTPPAPPVKTVTGKTPETLPDTPKPDVKVPIPGTQGGSDVVYADLDLGAGSGVIHGGSDTIYSNITSGPPPLPPKPQKKWTKF